MLKKNSADATYKYIQKLEFSIKLPENQYMNWDSVHIFLPIEIKTSTTETVNMEENLNAVNNSFPHGIFLDTQRDGDDLKIFIND